MKKFLLMGALMVASARAAGAQEEPTGSWAFETTAFYFARGGCATDGTYMYFFGGYQRGVSASYPSYYRRARRYDPATDTWTTIANLPIAESGITYQYNAGAYANGQLYSFGTSYGDGNGIVLEYSIADDAWTALDGVTLPDNRYGAAAATLGGLIYISGGFSGSAPTRRTDVFDPADNSFTRVADLPVALHRHAMAAMPVRNSVYAIGGSADDEAEAACYEYSPTADAWTERAPMSVGGTAQPRAYPAAFVLKNRVYVTGGHTGSAASSTTLEYHPGQDLWTARASMSSTRYQHGAVAIGGRGYVYGGLPGYTVGEEFTPPDFGPAPELLSEPVQIGSQSESSLQAKSDPSIRDGWTGRMVEFRAVVADPDPDELVRLKIRSRRPGEPMWTVLESGLVEQGTVLFLYSLPTQHAYDWEYRVEDEEGNSYPPGDDAWLPAFGNDATPDLRCNFTPPTPPAPLSPNGVDVGVGDPSGGDVAFQWVEATDDALAAGLVYDLEFEHGGETEGVVTVPAGPGATLRIPVSRAERAWRLRARDIAGNASPWSEPMRFRVVYDDRLNHAAGDGSKTCAYGAGTRPGSGILAPAWVLLLAAHGLFVRRGRHA